jgi:hypothetical protein
MQLLTSPQFLGLVNIEHPSKSVVIMYPTRKNATATRKRKKMGSHLETFALKAKDNVQSRTIPDFSDLPSSSMNNPFSNAENRKKKKQLQQVPLLPSLNNTNIVASYSRIEADCQLFLQESCIGVLNDRAELVKFT